MLKKTKLEKINEPGQIGRVKTKNRMVKCAASMYAASDDGYISDANLGFYEETAKSGVGLIFVEMAAVDYPGGYPEQKCPRIDHDRFIPRLRELTDLIHSYDVPVFQQLNHCGPSHSLLLGTQPKAASNMGIDELPSKAFRPTTGLTIPEIEEIVHEFAEGAMRAQEAGFDGVEVHGAHTYLINSFLSGGWNKRQDRYGGSLENRSRFACEVIKAIKERVGQEFPVGIRVNGAEYGIRGGLTSEESRLMCQMMQKSGADVIHVSARGFGPIYNDVLRPEQVFYPVAPKILGRGLDGSRKGPGALSPLAAEIKKAVSVPVITVGRLNPIIGEEVLRQGRADFIAFARCLIADPEIIHKVTEGRLEDIRPCTACVQCTGMYSGRRQVLCRVNAAVLKEREYVIRPAEKKKRVMVIGGGPAGMEAARVAAMRGHEVTLYERDRKLGGAMLIAATVKGLIPEDLMALTRYFGTQISRLGVKVVLGKEVDSILVKELRPDVVIVATGGTPVLPEISGIDKSIVASQERLYRSVKTYLRFFSPRVLRWLTNLYLPVGKKVVIIGGGIQGLEVAEFLVKRGRRVTVTEKSGELGAGMVYTPKERLLSWLAENRCALLSGVKYEAITDRGLILTTKEGTRQAISADTILTALELRPNAELLESLRGQVSEIYSIGDTGGGHLIMDAVHEGFKTALSI